MKYLNKMITLFNIILEQTNVIVSNVTTLIIKMDFHYFDHENDTMSELKKRTKDILK